MCMDVFRFFFCSLTDDEAGDPAADVIASSASKRMREFWSFIMMIERGDESTWRSSAGTMVITETCLYLC
jgi:hypothetical protein